MIRFLPQILRNHSSRPQAFVLSVGVINLIIALSGIAILAHTFFAILLYFQWQPIIASALVFVSALVAQRFHRRGQASISNLAIFGGLWGILSWNALQHGGLQDINFTALVICIFVAGLLLSVRGIILMAVGVFLTATLLLLFQTNQITTDIPLYPITIHTWLTYQITIAASTIFTIYTSILTNRTLTNLQKNGLALEAKNHELETQRAEQKQIELQLEHSKSLLEATFQAVASGVLVVDTNRNFSAVNKAFTTMWDIPPDLKQSQAALKYVSNQVKFPEDFLTRANEIYADPTTEVRDLVELKDGRIFDRFSRPQRMGDQIVGRVWTFRDISAYKKTEQALRETTELFRKVFELAPIGMAMLDMNGRYLQVNRSFSRILGYSASQLRKMSASEITHPDDQHLHNDLRSQLMKGEIPSYQVEKRYLRKDGSVVDASVQVSLIRGESGEPLNYIIQIIDLTEHKRAENAMRQAQKLESLGIMSGGIAHDFNNLLTAILAQSSLALALLPKESQSRANIEKVVSAAHRATDLTRQLLAYSGRGQFESKPMDLNSVIRDNLHLVDVAIESKAILDLALTEPLSLIKGDTGQIQQIVMNLIMNAAEAIHNDEGVITIHTDEVTIRQDSTPLLTYANRPLSPGRYIVLTIRDNGVGMSDETKSKIFDPFFTTKAAGRGLGLAAVLGIVSGHDGALKVESELNKGTVFELFFPTTTESLVTQHDSVTQIGHEPYKGKVLIIDDHEPILDAVCTILETEAIETFTACDGLSGIQFFTERSAEIRLILLDLSMPGLSGEETLLRLREIDARIPIILTSGYSTFEITTRFKDANVTAFLQKPYSWDKLVDLIRQYLDPAVG
ncbi:MAG: PAS domain S-box protein [Chloroflexota bacterium]